MMRSRGRGGSLGLASLRVRLSLFAFVAVLPGALAVGHAFLAKPFTPDALLSSVRASLDGPPPAPAAADQDPEAA
ncbi:MAG: hypothetical protein ACJ79R_06360 [Anaeromyxobacteraceae bacterium]